MTDIPRDNDEELLALFDDVNDQSFLYFRKRVGEFLEARAREAEERGVAWSIGVLDGLHMMSHHDSNEHDKFYKGAKNGLRDRYRAETGIDPAPDYPVNVKLTHPKPQAGDGEGDK